MVCYMCKLIPSIVSALKPVYIFNSIHSWTGSSSIFCWVKNDSKIHKTYVQRRLNKIRDVIKDFSCLKLIPIKMNPADIATRALSPLLLCFSGPKFLYSPESA